MGRRGIRRAQSVLALWQRVLWPYRSIRYICIRYKEQSPTFYDPDTIITMKQTLHFECLATRTDGSRETLGVDLEINLSDLSAILDNLRHSQGGGEAENLQLLAFVDEDLRNYARRVGIDRSLSSLRKYSAARTHLRSYLEKVTAVGDIRMERVDADFIRGFRAFMERDLHFAPGTVRLYLSALTRFWRRAQDKGLVSHNPFAESALPAASSRRFALTAQELARLRAVPAQGTARRVRDLFVWAAMTGLSFADIKGLRPADVELTDEGTGWLTKRRKKTGQTSVVLLTAEAVRLLHELPKRQTGEQWIDIPDNSTVNRHLRRLGEWSGQRHKLHFHTARHTFATLLLTAGVPIETVSTMLGHARIATTQIYAEVTRRKIQKETLRMTSAFASGTAVRP